MTAYERRERASTRSRTRGAWLSWLFGDEVEEPAIGETRQLGASPRRERGGWSLTLPVREEHIEVYRRPVVVETVRVKVRRGEEIAEVRDTLRREELVVDPDEGLDLTREDGSPRRT